MPLTVSPESVQLGLFPFAVVSLVAWILGLQLYRWWARGFDSEDLGAQSFGQYARAAGFGSLAMALGVILFAGIEGLDWADIGLTWPGLLDGILGVTLGIGLFIGLIGISLLFDSFDVGSSDRTDATMTSVMPESAYQWKIALLVTLPLVAVGEELLFRGGLIAALTITGWLPAWGSIVVSSLLFGLLHIWQGLRGVLTATGLGLWLAVGFVATGSLLVPISAHYVVNALVFGSRKAGFGSTGDRPAPT